MGQLGRWFFMDDSSRDSMANIDTMGSQGKKPVEEQRGHLAM